MKTAVEWLMEELPKNGSGAVRTFGDLFQQAKEMEKEQILDAHIKGHNAPSSTIKNWDAEKYYNQTFKQEQ
jgi:hypothetical protein